MGHHEPDRTIPDIASQLSAYVNGVMWCRGRRAASFLSPEGLRYVGGKRRRAGRPLRHVAQTGNTAA
jgi:hypothetical protein